MRYTIELREGYLRGELIERETAEETRQFGDALHAAMAEKGVPRVLVVVRASRAIFRVEEYKLSGFLQRLPGARVALLADSPDVAAAHEYVQLIAGQKGVSLRAFTAEQAALGWLLHDQGKG